MTDSKISTRPSGLLEAPGSATLSHEAWPLSTAHCVWFHALHLFHNFDWESSLRWFKRLLHCALLTDKRFVDAFPRVIVKLRYNIGMLQAMMGENYIASEEFSQCTKLDERSALAWYALGLAAFKLGDFRMAEKLFRECLKVMDTAKTETTEYAISVEEGSVARLGNTWELARTSVDHNIRKSIEEKLHKATGEERPMDGKWAPNGIPVGVLFGPSADMLRIDVNVGVPLIWENDGLRKYLERYKLGVKERQGRIISTKVERHSSVDSLKEHLKRFEMKESQVRTSSTRLGRSSSVATDKRLPPLPPATPGAQPLFTGDMGSVVRRHMIEKVRLAARRREKKSPERGIPSPIVPPKGIVVSRIVTSAPSTSNPIRNSQGTICGPHSSTSTGRRPSFVLPWESSLTASSPLSAHHTSPIPHEVPHLGEVGSRAPVLSSFNNGSIKSQTCSLSTYSSASSAHQALSETPPTATIDFAYDSPAGLRISGLDGAGRRELPAYSPQPNSSVYNLYLKREWAVDAETPNRLEDDKNDEETLEDEQQDYAEILLMPLTYQRPQFNDEDQSMNFDEEAPNERISMFIDTTEDPRPASSIYSTQSNHIPISVDTRTDPRPASSIYSTQSKHIPISVDTSADPRPASSIHSTQSTRTPTSVDTSPDPRPASSISSTQSTRTPISVDTSPDPRPASSISSTQSTRIPISVDTSPDPRPASSVSSLQSAHAPISTPQPTSSTPPTIPPPRPTSSIPTHQAPASSAHSTTPVPSVTGPLASQARGRVSGSGGGDEVEVVYLLPRRFEGFGPRGGGRG